MKQVFVTTSWDDGHKFDVRLASLLKKYGIKGTFYIAPEDHEASPEERLSNDQIKNLSKDFEIGAHTMTHSWLPEMSDGQARKEIEDSKEYLKKIIGKNILSFCYPRGEYEKRHVEIVRAAGFSYARTVHRHSFSLGKSVLEGDTTIHTYNHWSDIWKIMCFANFNPIKTVRYFQWDNLAKAMFDQVQNMGGIFHLWGHSWEIEEHGDWEKLEGVLRHISNKSNVKYVVNGELPVLQKKKILIVAPYFPPHLGGVEMYVLNIAKGLQKSGWEVCIVTSTNTGWRMAEDVQDGLRVFRLPYLFTIPNPPGSVLVLLA